MLTSLERLELEGWSLPGEAVSGVHYVAGHANEPISYPEAGLDVLAAEGGAGFWFRHRARIVDDFLRTQNVLSLWDIGSGTGTMAKLLTDSVPDIVAVEPLAAGAQSAAEHGLTSICGTLQDLRLPNRSIECIAIFDVLEHVSDARALINEIRRVLRPGGILIVTVPAFDALWGDEDDVAGHVRRYTKRSLRDQVCEEGLSEVEMRYVFGSLAPVAYLLRAVPYRMGRRRRPSETLLRMHRQMKPGKVTEALAGIVMSAEYWAQRVVSLPFGLSVFGAFISDKD